VYSPEEGHCEKRCEIQDGGQEMAVMIGTTIQENLVPNPMENATQNSLELSSLKLLPLAYHHSHFLATMLDFTSFFTMALFIACRATHLFYNWAILD